MGTHCVKGRMVSCGQGMREPGEGKFPRGAWPPSSLLPGAETFHLLTLPFRRTPCWALDLHSRPFDSPNTMRKGH